MTQFETTGGRHRVITTVQDGRFSSRLYVSADCLATPVCAKHKTESGARRWAAKTLAEKIMAESPK